LLASIGPDELGQRHLERLVDRGPENAHIRADLLTPLLHRKHHGNGRLP